MKATHVLGLAHFSKNTFFREELDRLLRITCACREDMHEPDEQALSVRVNRGGQSEASQKPLPGKLDNAFCDKSEAGFELVYNDGNGTVYTEYFNLAVIIALARAAQNLID